MPKYKIAVGLTSGSSQCHWVVLASFINMMNDGDVSKRYKFEIIAEQGMYIEKSRNHILHRFDEGDADYLLMLDHDNGFKVDAIDLFVEDLQRKDVHVVSGSYQMKKDKEDFLVAGYQTLITNSDLFMWFPVGAFSPGLINLTEQFGSCIVGAGIMMMDRYVTETVPFPWFETGWVHTPENDQSWFKGEDAGFCLNLKKHGIDLYFDSRIESAHMTGTKCYPPELKPY